jgi:hypothetical protein
MTLSPTDQAIESFRRAAISKGDMGTPATLDHQLVEAMLHALQALDQQGQEGQAGFRRLLEDPSPHVRMWAAAELLSRDDRSARLTLEQLTGVAGQVGFSARHTLAEYDAGRLKSPFQRGSTA